MTALGRGLGYLRDAHDARDLRWQVRAPQQLPVAASLQDAVVRVLNQGSLGSCVANSAMQAIRIRHVLQGVEKPPLGSRLFAYYMARAVDHTTKYDAGTHLRSCFHALAHYGFPDETLWPYTDEDGGDMKARFRRHPDSAAMMGAIDRKAPTVYRRIDSGRNAWDQTRDAIANGYPVCFGVEVSTDFVRGNFKDDHLQQPPEPDQVEGGHAMTGIGYEGDHIKVVNSWSAEWGDAGYCYFSRDYWEQARDLWVVEHSPIVGEG